MPKDFFPPGGAEDWQADCLWCSFANRIVIFKVAGKFQAQCPGWKKILPVPLLQGCIPSRD
ncbi:MAG: hypothetical protein EXR99_13795 [Gemmataceae bacterium]|nr:hypothetical protein [Gemmataceae bacterium]